MSKIPTAEEFLDNIEIWDGIFVHSKNAKQAMIEFAQLHVQAALEAADNSAEVEVIDWEQEDIYYPDLKPIYGVNSESILTAYPLENIK